MADKANYATPKYDTEKLKVLTTLREDTEQVGTFRAGYEGYGRLIRLLAESPHQSCLLLTSREKPKQLARLGGQDSLVRTWQLEGVGSADAQQMLSHKAIFG